MLLDARGVGGRARSNDRRGFRFNQGAHALYDAGAARPILLELGVRLTGGKPQVKAAASSTEAARTCSPTGRPP